MKVINLDSKYELTSAQISFAEAVMSFDRPERTDLEYPSTRILTDQIPIYLFSSVSMPDSIYEKKQYNDLPEYHKLDFRPSTEWLGFYQNSASILGIKTPIIGLCPERIRKCVKNDEELIILIAKVIVHEFAHAQMNFHPNHHKHHLAYYTPKDEFYEWMEEPLANLITLERFKFFTESYNSVLLNTFTSTSTNPLDFVIDFIDKQPDNYKLGLDFFNEKFFVWYKWRTKKAKISIKVTEKDDWLNYVKPNLRASIKKADLNLLFENLIL